MDHPWIIHGYSMDYPWIIHGLSMDYPWILHGLPMDYPGLSMDNTWIIYEWAGSLDLRNCAKETYRLRTPLLDF